MKDLFQEAEPGQGIFCPHLGDFCYEDRCAEIKTCFMEKFQDG